MPYPPAQPPRPRSLRRALATVLLVLAMVPIGALSSPSPVSANTSQFRGVNWAVLGDNFVTGPLVLHGLNGSDSYATVRAKADAVYTGFQNNLGVNTVRLPINTHTVGSSWWNAYTGVIDAATARGFKVILTYWEDGAASGGRVTDMAAFNSMWDTVTTQYGGNSLVHFEIMNEPHGYSVSEWTNLAASWINARPSVPRGRILVGGTGYSQDVRPVCADTRLNGTLLSYHHYAFFYGEMTYAAWAQHFRERLGSCASRTVLTEFGAPMDTGLNYNDPNSTNNFVRHIRAVTDSMRDLSMGSTYWPGLGGKITAGQNDDWYAIQKLHGSGTNLTLSTPNASGVDRLRHGWGDTVSNPGTGTGPLRNIGANRCLDVPGATRDNVQVIVYTCNGQANQQWTRTATGQITVYGGAKCLDAYGQGTTNNTVVGTHDCNGQDNQRWTLQPDGTIRGVQSGLCLDVNLSTNRVQLYSCWGGANQQWQS
jgi:hypothetical protein